MSVALASLRQHLQAKHTEIAEWKKRGLKVIVIIARKKRCICRQNYDVSENLYPTRY